MQGNKVTVIIPIYGDIVFWESMATGAHRSCEDQTTIKFQLVYSKGGNISECRNKALENVNTDWIIFLDADDWLEHTYIEEMLKKAEQHPDGDIFVPSVHRHYEDGRIDTDQHWYKPKDLMTGNYIVVSAMIRTSLFKKLGGFHDYESLEDWDLWLRAEEAGAKFIQCPEAILHISKRANSRNSNKSYFEILNNAKKRRGIS